MYGIHYGRLFYQYLEVKMKKLNPLIVVGLIVLVIFIANKSNFLGSIVVSNIEDTDMSSYVNEVKKLQQSFTITGDIELTEIKLKLGGDIATMRIVENPPSGNEIYSQQITGLSSTMEPITINIPNLPLNAGTYGIELSTTSTTWTVVSIVDPSSYSGRYWWYHPDLGYTEVENRDFWFEVYGEPMMTDNQQDGYCDEKEHLGTQDVGCSVVTNQQECESGSYGEACEWKTEEVCTAEFGTLCNPTTKEKQTYTNGCIKSDLLSQGYVVDLDQCETETINKEITIEDKCIDGTLLGECNDNGKRCKEIVCVTSPCYPILEDDATCNGEVIVEEPSDNNELVTCWAYSTSGCASFTTNDCSGEYFKTEAECNSFTDCPEFVSTLPTYINMEADCNTGFVMIAIGIIAFIVIILIIK